MARQNPVNSALSRKVLSQGVANPVGNGDNTDKGTKRNAPKQKNSGSKSLSQSVIHPVANKKNTGSGL